MHRFRSSFSIFRLRVVSVIVCLKFITFPIGIFFLLRGTLIWHYQTVVIAIALLLSVIALSIITWALSRGTRCPLCHVATFGNSGCSKNSNARKLFGSYALYAAIFILFRGRFRCPYCNEPVALELRKSIVKLRAR